MKTDPSHPTPKVVAIVSQQGGVGKTTAAVNLALALAAAGRTVLLIDLEPNGNAGRSLVRGAYGGGGSERALLDTAFSRDMIAATEIPELYLAPASPGLLAVEGELAPMGDSRTRLYQALATLPTLPMRFEHVVIDCPAAQGLLTLNAMTAAHRVLVPLPCDARALDSLPILLKTIGRLRAGLAHPFYGAYLLMSMCSGTAAARAVIDTARHAYGRMTLLTEIPNDNAVVAANANDRPLLVDTPGCPAARAYLSLAAEWLTLAEPGDQPDGAWHFKARQERIAHHRAVMARRIEAWLVDPSSLLYDEREASLHQDNQALDELLRVTQPTRRAAWRWRGGRAGAAMLGAALALGILVPLGLAGLQRIDRERWRIELGAWLIGAERYWPAGSLLLSRADATAYRELQLATRLLGDNREQVLACAEQALADGRAVPCRIEVAPP